MFCHRHTNELIRIYDIFGHVVFVGDGMDGMKNSPHNGGPGTPRDDMPPVSGADMGYNPLPYQDNVSLFLTPLTQDSLAGLGQPLHKNQYISSFRLKP